MITIIDKNAEDARRARIADAIRAKGGTVDSLAYPEGFISGITAIEQNGGGGNVAIGRISFPSDRVITQADPLILTHNLGTVPNIMCLFISKSIRRNSGNHDFFAILANQNGPKIGIKGSYMSGNYPEMYLYEAEGRITGGSHSSGSTFMDVWGATENEIKIGSFKDVSAMLPGNTEYIWLVAKE